MTGSAADPITPHIRIEICPDRVRVVQHRPALASSLAGMSASAALQLVPVLLPVCGRAQLVGARRAVAAATGDITVAEDAAVVEQQLWREQAFAAAWRYCIDWPELLGESRNMAELAAVRGAADDVTRGQALAQMISGLEAVQSVSQLLMWAQTGNCIAARVARRALDTGDMQSDDCCRHRDDLEELARVAFERQPFDPLAPSDQAIEVGPLAMGRDPLVAALQDRTGSGVAARVLAQLLDTRAICRRLAEIPGVSADTTANAWLLGKGIGMGRAMTSRGPVFHRVSLQDDAGDRVLDWRVIAPTDWHFAPLGPVVNGLKHMHNAEQMRLLVASFDPCAPCSLQITAPGA